MEHGPDHHLWKQEVTYNPKCASCHRRVDANQR